MMSFLPQIDSPMVIVTCADGRERSGCLVGFSTQCSIDPPRYLVCISIENHTFKVASRADSLAVHLLTADDEELAAHFGEETGDEVDKFDGLDWQTGVSGAPLLMGCAAHFEGWILERLPLGDHVGFLLAPIDRIDAKAELSERQLQLRDVEDLEAGHPA